MLGKLFGLIIQTFKLIIKLYVLIGLGIVKGFKAFSRHKRHSDTFKQAQEALESYTNLSLDAPKDLERMSRQTLRKWVKLMNKYHQDDRLYHMIADKTQEALQASINLPIDASLELQQATSKRNERWEKIFDEISKDLNKI